MVRTESSVLANRRILGGYYYRKREEAEGRLRGEVLIQGSQILDLKITLKSDAYCKIKTGNQICNKKCRIVTSHAYQAVSHQTRT